MRGFASALFWGAGKKIAGWFAEEGGHLFNLSPVGLALGIALYFSLNFEPDIRIGIAAVSVFLLLAFLVWRWALPRLVVLAFLMVSLGFASAEWRSLRVAAPQLAFQILTRRVEAIVENVQKSPDNHVKLILLNPVIAGLEPYRTPHRISVTIRIPGDDVMPGDVVGLKAVMMPPGAPAIPGAFDYARQSYFLGIGAVGYSVSPVDKLKSHASVPSWTERFSLGLETLRLRITQKFLEGIPGEEGGMAAALTTGIRDGIPANVVTAMRNSGLAHLLAIAGLHMGLVSGIVFFFLRAVLAAFPTLALAYPIKKWAAVAAAIVALGYLLISGASLPTIRAFAMGGFVFLAVILDRNPISMRLLALAAIIIFVLKPESLLNVSFQMSFAAVGALIAIYEGFNEPIGRWKRDHPGVISTVILYPSFVALTSAVATIATAPISIYHFNQIAVYAVLSNILAIPLVGFWIFPWAIIAFALMPFHLESLAMAPLGFGLKLLILIAEKVSSLPDAILNVQGFPLIALGVISFGFALLCLWRTPLRLSGLGIIGAGVIMAMAQQTPDILIDGQGKLMAVKGQNGRYLVSNLRADKYSGEIWLRSNGQLLAEKWPIPVRPKKSRRSEPPKEPAPLSHDPSLNCDSQKCDYTPWLNTGDEASPPRILLHFGKLADVDDCGDSLIYVSTTPAPEDCQGPAMVIDRFNSYYFGSHAIWISHLENGDWKFRVASSADERGKRPWSNNPTPPDWLVARIRVSEVIWRRP